MRYLTAPLIILLLLATALEADLGEGDPLPNPTLRAADGAETPLHDMLGTVAVLHLWKCN